MIVAQDTPVTANRTERILAYLVASAIGLSLIAFLAVIIGGATNADYSQGVWPVVFILPGIGLPVGFILIIVLLVLSSVRRAREAKDASK